MIVVIGLTELLGSIARVGPAIRAQHGRTAETVRVASAANARSAQMSRSVRSNRYEATDGGVRVTIGGGGGDLEWAVGAQYGSTAFRQFPARTSEGYTVIPAIRDRGEEIAKPYTDAITDLF